MLTLANGAQCNRGGLRCGIDKTDQEWWILERLLSKVKETGTPLAHGLSDMM
jgi:hypothetical protein